MKKNYLISILSLAILPAIFEELLFRGLILKGLKRYSKTFSIWLSTIAFCLFHMSFRQTLYPILFGLALGLVMYKENNIVYCMILHFVNNFTTLTLSYFNITLGIGFALYLTLAIIFAVTYLIIATILTIKNNQTLNKLTKKEKIYTCLTFSIMTILWAVASII